MKVNRTPLAAQRDQETIMQACVQVWMQQDMREITLKQVAAKQGFSTGRIYSNFSTRDEILEQFWLYLLRHLESRLAELPGTKDWQRFFGGCVLLEAARRHACFARMLQESLRAEQVRPVFGLFFAPAEATAAAFYEGCGMAGLLLNHLELAGETDGYDRLLALWPTSRLSFGEEPAAADGTGALSEHAYELLLAVTQGTYRKTGAPHHTTLCYLERDGQYLMLHRNKKKHDPNAGKWLGVGGGLLEGESAQKGVQREIFEETGLAAEPEYRGIVRFLSDNGDSQYMHLFTAKEFSGELLACNEGELHWIDKDEVLRLPLWEGDRYFLRLLTTEERFFTMTLGYRGDACIYVQTLFAGDE